jgi:hypothetical protein
MTTIKLRQGKYISSCVDMKLVTALDVKWLRVSIISTIYVFRIILLSMLEYITGKCVDYVLDQRV